MRGMLKSLKIWSFGLALRKFMFMAYYQNYLLGSMQRQNVETRKSAMEQKPEVTDYAAMMAILYSMVKQDCIMQEKIVTSLSLKSSSEELESYCLMWSLRPFVDDEIMCEAWKLLP
ncbi:unnamed protein product [Ilex paraguariensis]|uniref:Uncharacterized protein n=1 Tax=Ilex paraguariensis TaxID=185542 RepID=A0ABC8QTP4_9AQUA